MLTQKIDFNNLKAGCWLFIGLFITMPFFTFLGLNIYNYALILYIIVSIYNGTITFYKKYMSLYIFLIVLLISSIFSFSIVPLNWATYSLKAAMKSSVLLTLVLFITNESELIEVRKYFFKGIFLAAAIHLIWMFLQYVFFRFMGTDLNFLIFEMPSPTQNGEIVITGLSWERIDPVTVMIISILLTDNYFFKFIFLMGILATSSRTGIVMLLGIAVYDIIYWILKRKKSLFNNKISVKKVAGTFVIIFIIFLLLGNNSIKESMNYTAIRFQRIFTGGNDYGTNSTDGHILYYQWLRNVLTKIPFRQLLLGCGTNISGWVYTTFYNRFTTIGPWSVECDFIAVLLGNGIVGVFLYYYSFIKLFINQYNIKLRKILLAIFIGTFLYGFLASSLSLIVMLFCVSYLPDDNFS